MEKEIKYPILAIDYGDKHFGLAISDIKGILAQPLQHYLSQKTKKLMILLQKFLKLRTSIVQKQFS